MPAPPFRLGPTEHELLVGLGRYLYLTAAQCVRRSYRPGSLRFVQKRLGRLAAAGYCQRHTGFSRAGKPPTVYSLSATGWRYVRELGMEAPPRWRPAEAGERGFAAYAHDLAVADLGIAAERFCAATPHARLARFRHDRLLKADPLRVRLPDGRARALVFDAWLDLRLHRGDPPRQLQRALALELDRATVPQPAWRCKLDAVLAAAAGGYREHFGTASLTVIVVSPGNPRRARQLLAWTEAHLRGVEATATAPLFAFTGADPATADPVAFFCGPSWGVPFGAAAAPLFELSA